jgi:hypothetical protein
MIQLRFWIAACWFFCLSPVMGASVFDSVFLVPAQERIAKALSIYDEQVKRRDSVFSITAIRQLVSSAEERDDRELHCFSLSLLADQYARIRGFNPYSTSLHESAIALAKKHRLPLMIGMTHYRAGGYYYSFKKYAVAFEYLLRADTYFNEIGYKEVPDIDKILFFIGGIYYESGNYEKSEPYLLQIQQLKKVTTYLRKQSLNTLAMIHKLKGDTAGALHWFQLTLAEAEATRDTAWLGIAYGNMGSLYFANGLFEKAYPLLEQGSRFKVLKDLPEDAAADLLLMARIDLLQNKPERAADRIAAAQKTVKGSFSLQGRRNLYEALALYYERTGQEMQALEIQRKLMQVKDSISVSRDRQTYEKIQLRVETERHMDQVNQLEADARSETLQRNAVILILFLLLLVILLLYGRYRLKAKNTAAILQKEKQIAEEKLQHARQLLQDFTRNNRQKNELIERFAAELERLKANMTGDPVYEERLQNFEKLVQSTILTDAEWQSFRELFDKVHKGFFTRLEQKIPGLSLADTRILTLVRLQLPHSEMARMMGMDAAAIEASIHRLRDQIHPHQDGITIEDLVQAI